MIYKSEHVTDLESGVIVAAKVRCADEGDTADLAARVLAAGETLAWVCDLRESEHHPGRPHSAGAEDRSDLCDPAYFNRLLAALAVQHCL